LRVQTQTRVTDYSTLSRPTHPPAQSGSPKPACYPILVAQNRIASPSIVSAATCSPDTRFDGRLAPALHNFNRPSSAPAVSPAVGRPASTWAESHRARGWVPIGQHPARLCPISPGAARLTRLGSRKAKDQGRPDDRVTQRSIDNQVVDRKRCDVVATSQTIPPKVPARPAAIQTYIMSNSPPKEQDVEQGGPSGDEQDHMDREQEGAQGQGLGDFEVKEQDRWLPIANGWSCFIRVTPFSIAHNFDLFVPCVTSCASDTMALCESRGRQSAAGFWQIRLIRRRPLPFSHDLHCSSFLTGQRYLDHSDLTSCLLTILLLPLTERGTAPTALQRPMLTSATLLQSPES